MKNGAIIVKFKDRLARDLLYSNKLKLNRASKRVCAPNVHVRH